MPVIAQNNVKLKCMHRDAEGEEDCEKTAEFGHVSDVDIGEVYPQCKDHKCEKCLPLTDALMKGMQDRLDIIDKAVFTVAFTDKGPVVLADDEDGATGRVSRKYLQARLDKYYIDQLFPDMLRKEREAQKARTDFEARMPKFVPVDKTEK